MTNLDLREAFNVVSEVVVNRPEALREFDQIYMKISDMLLHAELVSRWVDGKSMVFLVLQRRVVVALRKRFVMWVCCDSWQARIQEGNEQASGVAPLMRRCNTRRW